MRSLNHTILRVYDKNHQYYYYCICRELTLGKVVMRALGKTLQSPRKRPHRLRRVREIHL